MPTTIQERDEMTATLHRTEQIAQENGFDFNALDVLSHEYYSTVIVRDQTTVESCIWALFTETVQQLPHNERVHNAPRVSDHTWSNACVHHSQSDFGWEHCVSQSLRTNGYFYTNNPIGTPWGMRV